MHFSIAIDLCLFDVTLLSSITLAHGWYCHWYRCLQQQPVALEVRYKGEVEGMTMSSPRMGQLFDLYMANVENNVLPNLTAINKPRLFCHYVDDIFL